MGEHIVLTRDAGVPRDMTVGYVVRFTTMGKTLEWPLCDSSDSRPFVSEPEADKRCEMLAAAGVAHEKRAVRGAKITRKVVQHDDDMPRCKMHPRKFAHHIVSVGDEKALVCGPCKTVMVAAGATHEKAITHIIDTNKALPGSKS